MKVLALLLLLLPFTTHALVNSTEVSDEQFEREFPWAVIVENPLNGGVCGGVLIAPDWVLTAAHCSNKRKQILVGNADRTQAKRIKVVRSIRHPRFTKEELLFDVGLMQLEEKVDLPLAPVAPDAAGRTLLYPGRSATLLGWGKIEGGKAAVDRLRVGEIKLNNLGVNSTQIVYSYRGGGPCGLDSGGPMIMTTLDGRAYIIGVASATVGNLCATGGGTAIYTNLVTVRDFIMKHVEGIY